MKHLMWTSIVALGLALPLAAQSSTGTFEAASIKRVTPSSAAPQPPGPVRGKTFYRSRVTAAALIEFGYDIDDFDLVDAPAWTRNDLFEVNAVAATELSGDEKRPLVRALLAERFHLAVRKAQREARYLALTLASTSQGPGPKLVKCEGPNRPAPGLVRIPRGGRVTQYACARLSVIVDLASRMMGIRVVDQTGLSGTWNFVLVYADPTLTAGVPDPAADSGVQPFGDALREQLGLKLEAATGPVDVLVVDSVEPPTEN